MDERHIIHCSNCGGSWYDDGNTARCPLCRTTELKAEVDCNCSEGVMDHDEAIATMKAWLQHLDKQKAKAETLARLATLARTGAGGEAEARRKMREIDLAPVVYDGARLRPAVEYALRRLEPDTEGRE